MLITQTLNKGIATMEFQKELLQFSRQYIARPVAEHFQIEEKIVPSMVLDIAPFVMNALKVQIDISNGWEYVEYLLNQFHYLASSRAIAMDQCALELFGLEDNSKELLIELFNKKYQISRSKIQRMLPTLVTYIITFISYQRDALGVYGVINYINHVVEYYQNKRNYRLLNHLYRKSNEKLNKSQTNIMGILTTPFRTTKKK